MYIYIYTYLVGGFKKIYVPFHIWDVILPIDSYFSRWLLHHQPDIYIYNKVQQDGHFGSIFFLGLTIHLTFSTGRHSSDENASLLSVAPVVQDIFGNQWDIGMLIFGNSILGICEYSDIGIWDI